MKRISSPADLSESPTKRARREASDVLQPDPCSDENKDPVLMERACLNEIFPDVITDLIQQYTESVISYAHVYLDANGFYSSHCVSEEITMKHVLLKAHEQDIIPCSWAKWFDVIKLRRWRRPSKKDIVEYGWVSPTVDEKEWIEACAQSAGLQAFERHFQERKAFLQGLIRKLLTAKQDHIQKTEIMLCECCDQKHLTKKAREQVKNIQSWLDRKFIDLDDVLVLWPGHDTLSYSWSDQLFALECLLNLGIPWDEAATAALTDTKSIIHLLVKSGQIVLKKTGSKVECVLPGHFQSMVGSYRIDVAEIVGIEIL